MTAPHLSVVLPTRNGAETLPALLHSLRSQRTLGAVEIVAVDSGSSDGTVELLNNASVPVITIGVGEFDHGATRNLAIARTRGEFVVLLVQDALPIGEGWLDSLVTPFAKDPMLAATFARQRARSGASALTRHYLDHWIASAAEGWRADLEGGRAQFEAMTPAERLRRCTFDNVASCIRRSVWEKHPFRPTSIAEDLEWAKEVLLGGYALRFVPDAVVEHSHERSAAYEYARTRLLHARLYDLFGLQTIPTAPALARAMLSSLARHLEVELRNPSQWPRAAALAVAWPLGQYRGARLARSGDVRPTARPGKV